MLFAWRLAASTSYKVRVVAIAAVIAEASQ
jgi:hypothetical protein